MTYKKLEQIRETRMWIGQIIVPLASTAIGAIAVSPEAREAISRTFEKIGKKSKRFLKNEEEKIDTNKTAEELAATVEMILKKQGNVRFKERI